jgi:hypothetical protein
VTFYEAIGAAGINPECPDEPREMETAEHLWPRLLALCALFCARDEPLDFFVSESDGAGGGRVYHDLWVFTDRLAIAVEWSANIETKYRVYPKRVSALKIAIEMSAINPECLPSSGKASVEVTFGTGQQERISASGQNVGGLAELLGTHLAPK